MHLSNCPAEHYRENLNSWDFKFKTICFSDTYNLCIISLGLAGQVHAVLFPRLFVLLATISKTWFLPLWFNVPAGVPTEKEYISIFILISLLKI